MESSGGPVERAQPSQTAMTAAAARAAHLIVDGEPVIFADTLAGSLLGEQASELLSYHRRHGSHLVLASARGQATCRSRYTEDSLAAAVERGIAQYVLLGAGLDSFAYRSPLAAQVTTFEVDHPATQAWKREQLDAAGITAVGPVTFVPFDFERQEAEAGAGSLARSLAASGFDPTRPALVSWLGVTVYLTTEAIESALAAVGGLTAGTELVTDYMLPAGLRDGTGESYVEQVAPVAASRGEPWLTFLAPADLAAMLTRLGFCVVRDLGQRDIGGPDLWQRNDALAPVELSRLVHAVV